MTRTSIATTLCVAMFATAPASADLVMLSVADNLDAAIGPAACLAQQRQEGLALLARKCGVLRFREPPYDLRSLGYDVHD